MLSYLLHPRHKKSEKEPIQLKLHEETINVVEEKKNSSLTKGFELFMQAGQTSTEVRRNVYQTLLSLAKNEDIRKQLKDEIHSSLIAEEWVAPENVRDELTHIDMYVAYIKQLKTKLPLKLESAKIYAKAKRNNLYVWKKSDKNDWELIYSIENADSSYTAYALWDNERLAKVAKEKLEDIPLNETDTELVSMSPKPKLFGLEDQIKVLNTRPSNKTINDFLKGAQQYENINPNMTLLERENHARTDTAYQEFDIENATQENTLLTKNVNTLCHALRFGDDRYADFVIALINQHEALYESAREEFKPLLINYANAALIYQRAYLYTLAEKLIYKHVRHTLRTNYFADNNKCLDDAITASIEAAKNKSILLFTTLMERTIEALYVHYGIIQKPSLKRYLDDELDAFQSYMEQKWLDSQRILIDEFAVGMCNEAVSYCNEKIEQYRKVQKECMEGYVGIGDYIQNERPKIHDNKEEKIKELQNLWKNRANSMPARCLIQWECEADFLNAALTAPVSPKWYDDKDTKCMLSTHDTLILIAEKHGNYKVANFLRYNCHYQLKDDALNRSNKWGLQFSEYLESKRGYFEKDPRNSRVLSFERYHDILLKFEREITEFENAEYRYSHAQTQANKSSGISAALFLKMPVTINTVFANKSSTQYLIYINELKILINKIRHAQKQSPDAMNYLLLALQNLESKLAANAGMLQFTSLSHKVKNVLNELTKSTEEQLNCLNHHTPEELNEKLVKIWDGDDNVTLGNDGFFSPRTRKTEWINPKEKGKEKVGASYINTTIKDYQYSG